MAEKNYRGKIILRSINHFRPSRDLKNISLLNASDFEENSSL
jgi:hypothetical protein